MSLSTNNRERTYLDNKTIQELFSGISTAINGKIVDSDKDQKKTASSDFDGVIEIRQTS